MSGTARGLAAAALLLLAGADARAADDVGTLLERTRAALMPPTRRTEYFDPAGLPYKVRTLEDVRTIDGHPTALRMRMRIVPDESESTLALSQVEYESVR